MVYGQHLDNDSDSFFSDEDFSDLDDLPNQPVAPQKKWDAFKIELPDKDVGSMAEHKWLKRFEKLMVLAGYILGFATILTATIVSKGAYIFMLAQVSPRDDRVVTFCNHDGDIPDRTKRYEVNRDRDIYEDTVETEQVAWIWALFFAYIAPEVQSFLRALRFVLFKTWAKPELWHFCVVAVFECLSAMGNALLTYEGLAQMDSSHALALSHCLCIVPSMLLLMCRQTEKQKRLKMGLDGFAILIQISGLLVWPLIDYTSDQPKMPQGWAVPVGLVLASFGWWEAFVDEDSRVPFVKLLHHIRQEMVEKSRYFVYLFVSLLKMLTFFLSMLAIVSFNGVLKEPKNLFNKFHESFAAHPYNVTEVQDVVVGGADDAFEDRVEATLFTITNSPTHLMLIQMGTAYGAYIFSKWACKVQIQGFAFAIPLTAVVPACMTILLSMCGARAEDECTFRHSLPDYLFFECPAVGDYLGYLGDEVMYLWFIWFLSQMWITAHIWFPKSARLASTEELFATPMYNAFFVDQSLALNRRRDGENDLDYEAVRDDLQQDEFDQFYEKYHVQGEEGGEGDKSKNKRGAARWKNVRQSDKITKIYGCATMWHETKEEMVEMLKSLFRIDIDYSARRLSQKYLQVVDPDYYEWETHILFDDAFELGDNDEEEQIVNGFVKTLVRCIDEAGSLVHCKPIKVKPPKKYPTPYGGRLVWTFPGKTKLVCHLKDKAKIRHKKRWSQCMYMYYLLGFKLMELPIHDERKEAIAANTYLLALDGDIDFKPDAITKLVDLMRKNKNLGAACGRIHPIGSGFMAWYQKFEYAIGHWLQKATEHVMGCVLCSPGCFSLFRAKALMDDNVMRMYTTKSEKPRDYVQYDQGEDRWLCTLLLQRGWRVEYSAASDAFTACPEAFDEFFNQRRRWMPSTIANIFDVLGDYKQVTKVNDDISIFYIIYQGMLMVGTVLGPGTIFLMLVGAFSIAFGISNATSFWLNLIPIAIFVFACYTLKPKVQLWLAQILSAVYALVMMAVMVGIIIQIQEDGLLAPTTMMTFLLAGSFILAAIVHPQEFWCLPYGVIYYITIPSMYMLLVIYSFFNMHIVSWGTREVPKKKTKAELEAEKKQEEDLKKQAKKKKKEGGLMDFLMSKADSAQKGGIDFSLANLCRCMLFTHDDENDPKKHIIKMAAQMEEISYRLGKIESAFGGGGGNSGMGFRRRSSLGRRQTRNSLTLPGPVPEEEEAQDIIAQEMAGLLPESSGSESEEEERIERDDLANPYWIEDRDLKSGPVDFLPGTEIQFWKDLIQKYLEPLIANKEKEKKQADELIALRNKMVFSFFMLNSIFIVVVFLLQQQKDVIYIRWPLGAEANVSYVGPKESPVVEVVYTYLELEPIGLVFVLFFASVLIIQIIGMLFHRWGTISQIISSTKFSFCERKAKEMTNEGTLDREAVAIVRAMQVTRKDEQKSKAERERDKFMKGAAGRRNTVHNLMKAQEEHHLAEEPMNLEKQFRQRFLNMDPSQLADSNDPVLRRLSLRRETLAELDVRRQSVIDGNRRRSTVMMDHTRRMSSMGLSDSMQDSDFIDDHTDSISGLGGSSVHFEHVSTDDDSSGHDEGSMASSSTQRRGSILKNSV